MNKTRMGKRVASLLLSLVMMLSLLPTAAYAAMGDADETQGASVSENGTRVSDDSNSGGDTGDLQVGDSEDGGTADDTTGAEGGADTTGPVSGNDSADPQDNEGAVMPVASSVVSTSAELVAAIAAASDGDTITLGEGDFTTYGNTSPKKSLTFEGAGTETVWTIGDLSKDARSEGNGDCSFDGCGTITFRNMTLKSDGADYRGFIRISNTVVENCTLEGKTAYWGYETAKFEGSTFNAPEGDYALWDYSTKAMTFEGCKFNISGKGVNVYVEAGNAGEATRTVAVNNCTVNSTKENKAFLNIKNSTQAYDVTLSGTNTVTGLAADGTTGSALYQVEATKVTETTGKTVSVKEKADDGTVKTVYEVKETVAETPMDLDAFIKAVVDSGYNYDGNGVTVKWSPATGCYDTREGHTCTAGNVKATGNTPNRVNAKYAQYQLFSGLTQNVTIKNVKFVYEATEFTVCANSGWAGSGTAANLAEFQFENEGDVKLLDCSFDGVAVAVYNDIETASTVVHGCSFTNITQDGGGYAIHYLKGGKIDVSENTFENVYRGMLVQSTVNKGTNIVNNNFSGIDAANSSCYMVKLLNVKDTDIVISGNTTAANAPVNVNVAYDGAAGAAIAVEDRISTIHTAETDGNSVKISAGGDQMTGYTAPSAAVADASGITVDVDGNVTVTLPAKTTYVAAVGEKKYETLQAAIDAATEKATVTLLADTRENVTIRTNRLTLDLNGHTLNGGTVKGKPALTVTARNVIVKDSSEEHTGTIMREDTAENSGVSSHYVIDIQGKGAFLTFESGNVKNDSGNKNGKGASLVRVGDDSVSAWPQLTIAGGTFTQDNFIVIKVDRGTFYLTGGTLNSAHSYAVENWYTATIKGGTVNGEVAAWTYSDGHNSDLTISGGIVNGDVSSVNYGSAEGKVAKVSITGGTVNGTLGTYTYDSNSGKSDATTDATKATIAVTGGTFSKDPTKYVVEDSGVTKNTDGTYGVAKAYLAKVGNTSYYTMEEAFKAQTTSSEAIVLLRDYTTGSTFNSGSINRTVDLAGHTWTCTGTDANSAAFEINYPDASLTVKNGKVVSSQLAGLIPSAMSGTITYDNSTLVFDGVDMTTTARSGIETNGNNTNDTVTLKNSTLNVPNGFGIYFPSSGTLTIDNSVINAKTMGVQVCAGSLNISGAGTAITVSGDGIDKTINDGAIEDGAAISIVNRTGYKGLAEIEVKDGKFKAKGDNAAVKAYDWDNTNKTESDFTQAAKVSVSGGTFSSAVDKSLCADGFIPTQNTDGTYGVKEGKFVAEIGSQGYESLQAAIDAAAKNATVTLLADTRENVTISTYGLTLDLNGHTLNGGTEKGKPALTVTNRVTVKDSSAAQTGTIMREDTDSLDVKGSNSHYVIDIQGKNGFLKFESGNVKNTSGIPGVKGASLIRLGNDNVAGAYPTLTITGGTFTQDNFIAIKVDRGTLHLLGGTVNSANSFAIENWNNAYIKGGAVNGTVSTWVYSTGAAFSKLTISGGTVNGNVASVNYDNAADKQARVYVTGGTVTGTLGTYTYKNGLVAMDETAKATIEVTGGTFKEDPTQYVVEGSAINKNDDGTFGVAKAYLAKVGETSYYTMDEAFHAAVASGETLTLLRDYTTGSSQNSGSNSFTIDLNDFTWTYTGKDVDCAAFEINYSDVTLTVKNGKVVSSQLAGLIPSAMSGTITYDNSGLVFENVEMTANGHSGIETNGSNTNDTVTLRNSTLNVPNGFGIYFPSSGTLTIDNSKINAKTMGVQVCSGSLNVTGADTAITVSGDGIEKTGNDGAIEDGAAISIVERTGYKGLSEIKVSGGTFTAKAGNAAVKAYKWENQTASAFDNSKNVVAVSGGTFSSAVDKSLCADGFIPTDNGNGTYGVKEGKYVAEIGSQGYESLQEAINAAQDGQTVTLLADATEDVVISKSITLDLGGKTLTNTNAGKATISVTSGTVTVKNGNVVGGTSYYNIEAKKDANLTLTDVTATAGNNGSSMIDNYGTLTITSGTYTGGLDTVKNEPSAKLNITGGTFTLTKGNSDGFTGVVFNYGELTISGGEFIQSDKSAPYGQAQVIHTDKSGSAAPSTVITGGTFKNLCTAKTTAWVVREMNAAAGATKVSGGAFNKEVKDYYCADGFIPTKNADGTYGVKVGKYVAEIGSKKYETLADAIRLAAKGKTITLLADVEQNTQLSINKSITLDLNGKTIKISGYTAEKAQVSVKGNLTIQDSSEAQTGKICSDYTGTAGRVVSVENGGKLTIAGGTITTEGMSKSGSAVYIASGAEVNMTGGTVKVDAKRGNAAMNIRGSTGVFTMSGGSVIAEAGDGTETNITAISGISGSTIQISAGTVSGPQAVLAGSSATTITGGNFTGSITVKNGSISGGTFDRALDKNACAAGYVPADNGNGTYGVAVGKFTVKVTSRTTGSDSPVANVAGGGSDITYAEGTTVTASAISGYNFVGWFVNEYTGTAYSTALTCEVKPTDDCTMIAVYEPISGGKFWLTVTASEFTVNGGAVQDSYLYEQFAVGASVTVNFTGSENFLYWVNASNKVVSTDKSYTFIMGSETTLKAVYGKARQNQATVVFISHSDQIISSKAYTTNDTIQFPVPPIKMGCTFTGWSMTEADIRAAMANNSGIIQVRALYTEPSIACKVTVVYPEGTDNQVVNAVVGKAIDVTAKDIEGKTFSYWTDNDGNILGYTKTLKLAPSGDMTVKAVYGENVEVKPVITISEVSATTANESYVVTFMATRAVPDGYKVVKQGILWSRDAVCGEDGAAAYMQFDSNGKLPNGVNAYIGNSSELNGVTRLDITTKYNDRTFYGRGYMVLESDAGELLYIYTNTIASGSYDSLTK